MLSHVHIFFSMLILFVKNQCCKSGGERDIMEVQVKCSDLTPLTRWGKENLRETNSIADIVQHRQVIGLSASPYGFNGVRSEQPPVLIV